MKRLTIFVLSLSLICVACAHKTPTAGGPQEAIVGTWWSMAGSQKISTEFRSDGTYTTTLGGQTTNGTYRWLDDTTIEMNGRQIKIGILQDKLTMTIGSEVSSFQRETTTAAPQGNAATAAPSGVASITKVVLASRMTPLTHTPIDVVGQFPAAQGVIYAIATVANAPSGTQLKAVITAIDTNNAQPPNTQAGQPVQTTMEGSQNIAFHWNYPSLPAGTYKVDVYLNGTLNNTQNFSVTKDATAAPAVTPGAIGSCPALPAVDEKPPGFALGVAMAQGVDAQRKPVNPGRIFTPGTPAIYAVITAENVPANTRLSARWFATDLGGVEACNTQIATFEVAGAAGTGNFFITPPAGSQWPEGLYRVETYVNGNLSLVTDFGVCDGQCKFQVPISWKLP